ncbi:MAG: hypothetical protein KA746_17705 [Pyrinomonadaceae bacterium]|nr:hypothetical protein [Pyrinomonadaceae bacterium]MBP6212144.1 hypothetical protein [Pyrinomonadaceae bacterium]
MSNEDAIRTTLGDEWIPAIYENKVRTQRTRSYKLEVPARENIADINYTLLGIELKVGKRRFACPDLAAARYMRVFARLGCGDFAVPYDITRISTIADEMETSWHKMLLLIDAATAGLSQAAATRFRNTVLRVVRSEIAEIGPGAAMPEFNRETRQRPV